MIYLKDVLKILPRNKMVSVLDEFKRTLYRGPVASLLILKEFTYICSCPLAGIDTDGYNINFIISYD